MRKLEIIQRYRRALAVVKCCGLFRDFSGFQRSKGLDIGAEVMINELTNSKDLSMSSRDIAELVESRHDSVKRAIERLAENGVISRPPLVDGAKSSNGVVEKVYVFNAESKRDTFIVVAQLSPKFTARLVDRWQELEEQAAGPRILGARN